MSAISIRKVLENEYEQVVNLINQSYRENLGWTNEFNLFSGERISLEDFVARRIGEDNFFVAVINNMVIGCIKITVKDNLPYIGFFAVDYRIQGAGLGTKLLERAFLVASMANYDYIYLSVINLREELVKYYERRGFVLFKDLEKLTDINCGEALVNDLALMHMRKKLIK